MASTSADGRGVVPVDPMVPADRPIEGVRQRLGDWTVVDHPVHTRQRFMLDGIERIVTAVMAIPPSITAIQFLPDFDRPECRPCGAAPEPPAADTCLSPTGCPVRALQAPGKRPARRPYQD
jgi:hypothetical protein